MAWQETQEDGKKNNIDGHMSGKIHGKKKWMEYIIWNL
jgi:hypothetical protein